jgi:hypothetical protein
LFSAERHADVTPLPDRDSLAPLISWPQLAIIISFIISATPLPLLSAAAAYFHFRYYDNSRNTPIRFLDFRRHDADAIFSLTPFHQLSPFSPLAIATTILP